MSAGPRWHARWARVRGAFGAWCEQALVKAVLSLGRTPWGISGQGRARGVLRVFLLAERIEHRRHPLHAIQPGGYVRYEIGRLPRGSLPLPSQPPVRAGERVLMLHFDNPTIVDLTSRARGSRSSVGPGSHARGAGPSWRLLRDGRAELATLAEMVRQGAFPPDVRAAWAETIFASGIARLGFTAREQPPGLRTTLARLYYLGLIAIHGDGPVGLRERRLRHMRLGELWMGLDELQQRFGAPRPVSQDEGVPRSVSQDDAAPQPLQAEQQTGMGA